MSVEPSGSVVTMGDDTGVGSEVPGVGLELLREHAANTANSSKIASVRRRGRSTGEMPVGALRLRKITMKSDSLLSCQNHAESSA